MSIDHIPFSQILRLWVVASVLCLFGCTEQPAPAVTTSVKQETPAQNTPTIDKQAVVEHFYQDSVISWQEVLDAANELQQAIHHFLEEPGKANLDAALTTWESCHTQYLAVGFYQQLGLPPLDALIAPESPVIHSMPLRIDQQPLILGYLDSVAGYPQSGLIYSEIPLNEDTLIAEHQLGDTAYVAMGFHALRALIEGDNTLKQEPEQRFSPSLAKTEVDVNRRRQLLGLFNDILHKDLKQNAEAWLLPQGAYSALLKTMPQDELVTRIRQATQREAAALAQLSEQADTHVPADAVTLRTNRVTRLEQLL